MKGHGTMPKQTQSNITKIKPAIIMKIKNISIPQEVIQEHKNNWKGIEYIFYRPYPSKLFRCQLTEMPGDELLDIFNEFCFIKGSIVYMHESKLEDALMAFGGTGSHNVMFSEQSNNGFQP